VAPQEHPGVVCRLVDVVRPDGDAVAAERLASALVREMAAPPEEGGVALRGPHRWVRQWQPAPAAPARDRVQDRDVVLVTGGLGGVGFALARHLAATHRAQLVIVGRGAVAADDARVAALTAHGAEVLALAADVSDAPALRRAVDTARARFGRIAGVIHAAGVAGGGLLARRRREDIDRVLAPKLAGTAALLAAFDGSPPDWLLLCSSLSALTGGVGQADYAAANAAVDALAVAAARAGVPAISVAWDVWRDTGMAAGQRLPDGLGIDPVRAGELLDAVLALRPAPHVAVSTRPLAEQFAAAASPELADRLVAEAPRARASHPRPALATPYVAPGDDLARALAALWSEHLGITPIGAHDNFFELGGDSLLAIQLLTRVRKTWGVALQPAALFQSPTVDDLAAAIEGQLIAELERDEQSAPASTPA